MDRAKIIDIIGDEYYVKTMTSENGEFFYGKEFKKRGMDWDSIKIANYDKSGYYDKLDIRFVNNEKNLTICVETKYNYKESNKDLEKAQRQLDAYMKYEKIYSSNEVVGILANTSNNEIIMYKDYVSKSTKMPFDVLVSMKQIVDELYPAVENKKEKVMTATYKLNDDLENLGVNATIRSQFVGTCLLALKNNLRLKELDSKNNAVPKETSVILANINTILESLLECSTNKAEKIVLLAKVLENQTIKDIPTDKMHAVLNTINNKILPFINDETTAGQDILNLFFNIFNKYVYTDHNQAFTPDHITEFMCKITGVDRNSIVLDPCCGSGSFLVRALVTERNDCMYEPNKSELIDDINRNHIFGFEYSDQPFSLSTTNMLIHGDGNTNIKQANCFDKKKDIQDIKPTVILMNPPYNARSVDFPKDIVESCTIIKDKKGKDKEVRVLKTYCYDAWGTSGNKIGREDPTKGLCFVDYISDCLREAKISNTKLAVLVPVSCAIGTKGIILQTKQNLLKYNTLEAVFTLPEELFFPGVSAQVCCMLFTMGVPHCNKDGVPNKKTYFGYYKEDGFKKKKNLGRVEQINKNGDSIWKTEIEPKWYNSFINGEVIDNFSAKEYVTANDEWLCEAYMKTDYSQLTENDFQKTLNNYLSYLVKEGYVYES